MMAGSSRVATLKATEMLGNLSNMGTWEKETTGSPASLRRNASSYNLGTKENFFTLCTSYEGPILGTDRILGRQRFMGRVLCKER